MQELLIAVARGLVEDKDAVRVTVDPAREDGTIVYHLSVAEGDMGRVIGKQGRIAARAKKLWLRSTDPAQPSTLPPARCFLFACNPA